MPLFFSQLVGPGLAALQPPKTPQGHSKGVLAGSIGLLDDLLERIEGDLILVSFGLTSFGRWFLRDSSLA